MGIPSTVGELILSIVAPMEKDSKCVVRTLYDPTAGTGGMLSVAGEYLAAHNVARVR